VFAKAPSVGLFYLKNNIKIERHLNLKNNGTICIMDKKRTIESWLDECSRDL